jgi:hypothetical protein
MGTEYIGGFGPIDHKTRVLCDFLVARLSRAVVVVSDRRDSHSHSTAAYDATTAEAHIGTEREVKCVVCLRAPNLSSVTATFPARDLLKVLNVGYLELRREECGHDIMIIFNPDRQA